MIRIVLKSTNLRLLKNSNRAIHRHFADDNSSFRNVIGKMKEKFDSKDDGSKNDKDSEKEEPSNSKSEIPHPTNFNFPDIIKKAYDITSDNFKLAWDEMTGKSKPSALKRNVQQAASFKRATTKTDESDEVPGEKYDGPTALVLVKESESAWQRMKDRLQDSPFIRDMLKKSRLAGKVAAETDLGKRAMHMTDSVKDKLHDAREFWETSQNPLVYTLSGMWENLTGETEEGLAIAEIRKLDPSFVKEDWAAEIKENVAPAILKAHLVGDIKVLKPWCGEAVFNKLAAEIRSRKSDGIVFDPNILSIEENRVIMRILEEREAVALVVYTVQQINCIRDRKGEIKEGSETDIRAKFYSMAFKQQYDEDEGVVRWLMVDYAFLGDIPYL